MNRLQKKCLIAAAGTHLLIVVTLLCSGFMKSDTKVDNTQVLDMIPANVLENVMNQGVRGAQLPPPMPEPPKPLPPIPDPPKPDPTPEKVETPKPEPKVEPKVEPVDKPDVEIPKPKPTPPKKHEVKVDLKLVKRDNKQAEKEAAEAAEKAALDAKRERDRKLKAFRDIANKIRDNASTATSVDMPGTGSVSYANYASVVRSVYEQAWIAPDNADNEEAVVKVSVTIARNGQVVSSRIVNGSGDSKVDNSIQRTLDRVRFVREFPDGAKESEKTFIINFNLKAKRMLG